MVANNTSPEPVTIRRASGNWLAVSSRNAKFKIGVTGNTEEEAVKNFIVALREWESLLASS